MTRMANPEEARYRAQGGYKGKQITDSGGQRVAVWNDMRMGYCGSIGTYRIGSVDLVREDGVILDKDEVVYVEGDPRPHVLRIPRYGEWSESLLQPAA